MLALVCFLSCPTFRAVFWSVLSHYLVQLQIPIKRSLCSAWIGWNCSGTFDSVQDTSILHILFTTVSMANTHDSWHHALKFKCKFERKKFLNDGEVAKMRQRYGKQLFSITFSSFIEAAVQWSEYIPFYNTACINLMNTDNTVGLMFSYLTNLSELPCSFLDAPIEASLLHQPEVYVFQSKFFYLQYSFDLS